MQLYFAALIALSLAGVIQARCSMHGLRLAVPRTDRAFRILGRAAFGFWLVLLAWGALELHWTQPVAGLAMSLGANALLVQMGTRPWWPGASMGLSVVGLVLTSVVLAR